MCDKSPVSCTSHMGFGPHSVTGTSPLACCSDVCLTLSLSISPLTGGVELESGVAVPAADGQADGRVQQQGAVLPVAAPVAARGGPVAAHGRSDRADGPQLLRAGVGEPAASGAEVVEPVAQAVGHSGCGKDTRGSRLCSRACGHVLFFFWEGPVEVRS